MQFRHIFDHTSSLDIAVPHGQVGKPRSKLLPRRARRVAAQLIARLLSGSSTQP
jgi:hypothetical protein